MEITNSMSFAIERQVRFIREKHNKTYDRYVAVSTAAKNRDWRQERFKASHLFACNESVAQIS